MRPRSWTQSQGGTQEGTISVPAEFPQVQAATRQNCLPDRKASQSKRKSASPSVLPEKHPKVQARWWGFHLHDVGPLPGLELPSSQLLTDGRSPFLAASLRSPAGCAAEDGGSPPHGWRRKFSKPSFSMRLFDTLHAHE